MECFPFDFNRKKKERTRDKKKTRNGVTEIK